MPEDQVSAIQYPTLSTNYAGQPRQVGIELEFAGLELDTIAAIIIQKF